MGSGGLVRVSDDTVVVAEFTYRHQGEVAQGFLQNAGIPAALFGDDAGGMEPQLMFVRPARLVVPAPFEARAREVLETAGVELVKGSD
jgi:hypothetical protein